MAINHRRGKIGDFDPNKMTTAEWAFPDDGTARYCVAPGNVKTVATKEELQEILTSSPEAYQALLQLINNLEDNPSELTNILNNISSLQDNVGDLSLLTTETKTNLVGAINEIMDGKFNISDLVHTDTISDMKKAPSTAVTYALGQEIDTINNNLADVVNVVLLPADETISIPLQGYKAGSTFMLPFASNNTAYEGLYVIIKGSSTYTAIVPLLSASGISVTSENTTLLIRSQTYSTTCQLINLTAFMS